MKLGHERSGVAFFGAQVGDGSRHLAVRGEQGGVREVAKVFLALDRHVEPPAGFLALDRDVEPSAGFLAMAPLKGFLGL